MGDNITNFLSKWRKVAHFWKVRHFGPPLPQSVRLIRREANASKRIPASVGLLERGGILASEFIPTLKYENAGMRVE